MPSSLVELGIEFAEFYYSARQGTQDGLQLFCRIKKGLIFGTAGRARHLADGKKLSGKNSPLPERIERFSKYFSAQRFGQMEKGAQNGIVALDRVPRFQVGMDSGDAASQ